ncbi:hypothetical protein TNCT_271831, partial [Trichonephila clavata]
VLKENGNKELRLQKKISLIQISENQASMGENLPVYTVLRSNHSEKSDISSDVA